jgi:hypothetical protein
MFDDLGLLRQKAIFLSVVERCKEQMEAAEARLKGFAAAIRSGGDLLALSDEYREISILYRKAIHESLNIGYLENRDLLSRFEIRHVGTLLEKIKTMAPNFSDNNAEFLDLLEKEANIIILLGPGERLPDLAIDVVDVNTGKPGLDPYPPVAYKKLMITFSVNNIGKWAVDQDFDVQLFLDNTLLKTWTRKVFDEKENIKMPLEPGRGYLFSYSIDESTDAVSQGGEPIWPISPGMKTLRWVVDPQQAIKEITRDNNSTELTLEWVSEKDLPKLVVEDLSFEQPSGYRKDTLLNGEPITWKIRIANLGNIDAIGPFWTMLKDNYGNQIGLFSTDLLIAHESREFSIDEPKFWRNIGELTVTATVDYSNIVTPPGPDGKTSDSKIKINKYKVSRIDLELENRRVFLIIIDGLKPDKLNEYVSNSIGSPNQGTKKSGFRLMGLGKTSPDPDGRAVSTPSIVTKSAQTVFPSITLCANASIATGLFPSHHGILGNSYYKRDTNQYRGWTSKELAPTLFGCYDGMGTDEHFYEVLNGKQTTSAGAGGLDKELAEIGVKTVYDHLTQYGRPSHVVYHFYSKGAGYPPDLPGYFEVMDGWDPPNRNVLLNNALQDMNDDIMFLVHFDTASANTAIAWLNALPKGVDFPSLFTIYFASIDHACEIQGLHTNNRDIQREYLTKIDQQLFNLIDLYKKEFPGDFDNTVFIVASDHGHMTVKPDLLVEPENVQRTAWAGPSFPPNYLEQYLILREKEGGIFNPTGWGLFSTEKLRSEIQPYMVTASNGTMMHIYFSGQDTISIECAKENLCWNYGHIDTKSPEKYLPYILGRDANGNYRVLKVEEYTYEVSIPGEGVTLGYTEQRIGYRLKYYDLPPELHYIEKVTNHPNRSGDLILIVNQKAGYQIGTPEGYTIFYIPLLWSGMRIPYSENYNCLSTHGGIYTMDVPLVFAGRPVPYDQSITQANIVDIAPTILELLGVPILQNFDGKPLLDKYLHPIPGGGTAL